MSIVRSPIGNGKGVARSDSQPNHSRVNALEEYTDATNVTFRNKPKCREQDDHVCDDLTEMRQQMSVIMTTLTTINNNQKDFIDRITDDITEIKTQVNNIKSTIESITTEQNIVRTEITCIKNKNISLENKIESLEATIEKTNLSMEHSSSYISESVLAEIKEREIRSKNIILLGLPEPIGNDKYERVEKDKTEAIKTLKTIIEDCPDPERIYRLGKYDAKHNRPIKITFKSKDTPLALLRKKKNLTSDLKMFSDQTPLQQRQLRDLQKKLKCEHDKGNKHLVIKYIRGIPKIIDPSKN